MYSNLIFNSTKQGLTNENEARNQTSLLDYNQPQLRFRAQRDLCMSRFSYVRKTEGIRAIKMLRL